MESKALHKLTHGIYVVGVKDGDKFGGCIVDAVAQVAMGSTPQIVLASMLKNYTNELIKKEEEFTLSIVGDDIDPFVIANFGFQSARKVNKWNNVGHTMVDGLPVIDKAISYLRLKVTQITELETHSMFLCEITDAWLGESTSDPLVFGDYQKDWKGRVMDAFNEYNKNL